MKRSAKHLRLARRQLDKKMCPLSSTPSFRPPPRGWIQAFKDALGMTGRQLAKRLGFSPSRITKVKEAEIKGTTTLRTMSRFAEAMGCRFVYALVPITTLEDFVRQRAEDIIRKRMKRVHHTMSLEGQALTERESNAATTEAVNELLRSMPRNFWDDEPTYD